MNREEIFTALQNLVTAKGYFHSLALMVWHDLFFDPAEILEINWRTRISFREFSLLFGLIVKYKLDLDVPSSNNIYAHIRDTYDLLHQLHECHNALFSEKLTKAFEGGDELKPEFGKIFGSGDFMTEPIFYGGSGAYDFQLLNLAVKRYESDNNWLLINKGATINDLVMAARDLQSLMRRKLRDLSTCNSYEDYCRAAVSAMSFRHEELVSIKRETRKAFLDNFSLIPGTVNAHFLHPGSYNRFESHPILKIGQGEYFLPVWFNLCQSIYESPFYWMSEDRKYRDVSFEHRGKATEEMAYEMLSSVCGTDHVFRGVTLSKNKGEILSDIDVLAILGNKAIIVQAKSKKLTQLARRGNEEYLRSDFKDGIQRAYEQGLTCRNAILEGGTELILQDGDKLLLRNLIDEAYLICVTSDEYPAVLHQVDAYLSKQPADPLPIAMSLFDLQILTFYLCDPFDLFYYVRQRVALGDYFKGGIEMSLLAYHLNRKLFRLEGQDLVMIDDTFAQLIDANYPPAQDPQFKEKFIEKLKSNWMNPRFEKLISQVKKSDSPGLTDVVFFLLDLAGEGADRLMDAIAKTITKAESSGKLESFTLILDNGMSGVSFVAKRGAKTEIESHTVRYSIARKYITRAQYWLGLGTSLEDHNLAECAVYNKIPWKEDPELDELAQAVLPRPGTPLNKWMQPISENELCFCGSGRNYKKCHGA